MTILKNLSITTLVISMALVPSGAQAITLGYADVVLDYSDSGAGPIPGPYGGIDSNSDGFVDPGKPNYQPVNLDVVLGNEQAPSLDYLSLPTGSFITVGFTDETVINGSGNDIFIRETGASGDRANVFVSSNSIDFILLGTAQDDVTTALDLATIGFTKPVQAVKIVGLDNLGVSPGFDVANVQVLPGSIGPAPEIPPSPPSTEIPFEFSPNLGLLILGAWAAIVMLKTKVQKRKVLEVVSLNNNGQAESV